MRDVSGGVEGKLDRQRFASPSREFGILPFWFLNGELDPDEMRWQLGELRDKGMHGVILHGRYGLEMPYMGERYLDRIRLATQEANRLGLATWIYDEMNWPSGTADKRVLAERPDLAQRYIECLSFTISGPWFMCLTGEDSRYLDFEGSTPVAAFAVGTEGQVVDLTPNLSFEKVVPWEVPPGEWRLMYIVEKRADYYIDALDPESTAEFLRIGYQPYLDAVGANGNGASPNGKPLVGFYSDEPAMHYFKTGGDDAIVPWTKDMFSRFAARNGYDLRPRLPELFFELRPDSARVRFDFYNTLTDFYSNAYYRQIHEWCRERGLTFTAHLLYEEWLRRMIRVEGNLFSHYRNMDVVAVDHLYPVIGTRETPDQHVAIKVASSAAHQVRSPRLICESFGGIFMDATMQRMKWIADWEYVLGVNLLNPHGFHYTYEGPRKRDWPPSMFYQYPWWRYYGEFSTYMSRLSDTLSGGRHVAKVAVLWPINAMFATYTPQARTPLGDRIEQDFNALTDLLLRLHHDFDYLDEDGLAAAEIGDGRLRVADEEYEVLVVPPLSHITLATLERVEALIAGGGRLLGAVMPPGHAFTDTGMIDVSERVARLFGTDPSEAGRPGSGRPRASVVVHDSGGRSAFVHGSAIGLMRQHENAGMTAVEDVSSSAQPAFAEALSALIEPDVVIDNEELFYLHRQKDGSDLYFVVNTTFEEQRARVGLGGEVDPVLWDPSTGDEVIVAPSESSNGRTWFDLALPPAGSAFVVPRGAADVRVTASNMVVEEVSAEAISGYGSGASADVTCEVAGETRRLHAKAEAPPERLLLGGEWDFRAEDPNAIVVGSWMTVVEREGADPANYAAPEADDTGWVPMVPGAWSHQLSAEPARPYPIPVWHRIAVEAATLPVRVDLLVDGFAGSEHSIHVNGVKVEAKPERSHVDSQMRSIEITEHVREGRNVIAVRLVVRGPTDGLLDRVKLLGDFSVEATDGGERIAAPRRWVRSAPWTEQGYPYLSGLGVYGIDVEVPAAFEGCRAFLHAPTHDDVIEVLVNGASAGVRLWDPYRVEVTELLRPGRNRIEIRVANTAANLIGGTPRPSGLSGAPYIEAFTAFRLPIPAGDGGRKP